MAPIAKLVDSLRRPTVSFQTKYVEELTKALIKGIRILLTCEGYKVRTESERKSIDHIVDLLSPMNDDEAVSAVKYLTAIYLPRLVDDEEPERPGNLTETSTLFTHEYGRFIKKLLNKRGGVDSVRHRPKVSNRALKLAFSILQLKRYCPPLPKSLKTKALKGLKERLTTPAKTPEHMLQQLRRTANELFPPGWDQGVRPPNFTVTNKSCYENSRAKGGAQGYMFHREWCGEVESTSEKIKRSYEEMTEEEFELVMSQLDDADRTSPIVVPRGPSQQILDFELHRLYGTENFDTPVHGNSVGRERYMEAALSTAPSTLRAIAEVVEDPLKARIITKNNWQCTVLKPLQKMIHSRLRSHEPFVLIGAPLTADIVNTHLRQPEGTKWVSGDYTAATDNIHSDATDAVLHTIVDNMTGSLTEDSRYLDLAKRSLTGLTIYHEELGEFVMERGQLMGSLLSFPILCIINFSVWRHGVEMTTRRTCNGKGLGGDLDHVLINGDDIGFAAGDKQYRMWKKMVPLVGLSPSMGKNYFTDVFLSLNSQIYTRGEESGYMGEVKFTNLGLLVEPNEETLVQKLESLGQMHDDFVGGCTYSGSGSSLFIDAHQALLKRSVRNLFGPRGHGGLGATPVKGSKGASLEGYNVRQLVIAHLLEKEVVRQPSLGEVARYDKFQKAYVQKVFPDVHEARSDRLHRIPQDVPFGYHWENVTELVGEAAISHRAMVSWLAPLLPQERPAWDFWNKCKKLMDRRGGEWQRVNQMTVDDYLRAPAERAIYRMANFEFPVGDDFEACFE